MYKRGRICCGFGHARIVPAQAGGTVRAAYPCAGWRFVKTSGRRDMGQSTTSLR
ncbi:hypothetical protein D554_2504 [Bordetella holmesii 30539]|uniref:Uncharacterized protein n=2 Tax=Bordetella holmesii TaxID=35814 RepID=A0A158M6K3_9BORD|nr:hypothetical protein D560_2565 [Bordetella holmesii ATCC 51541]AIT27208.1 hypothetical protein D558_2547 [Bordetella holmesii 44057]EWM41821.1 hypothetical protein D556_2543 [Bordetella holmesii 41130]EWM47791.1 hypothetical protein D555_2582 [Bordetella holmesii 35009]EWM51958.1 hypothetical protein D557_1820 [Bordetella holmesii 70147]EXF87249.1 hypothetical protein D554_2504 [Bordetella holmesii 30539]EXX93254.1 hypothetical protein D559_0641 [Bordetella holmesii 1058]KAK84932.1 hypoth